MQDRTTFIIAHRFSTIRRADIIVVLEDDESTNREEELMAHDGLYRRLFKQVGDEFVPAAGCDFVACLPWIAAG
jgi:ABC-type multidrug transport system fused ATPase/permease subunit